MKIIKSVPVLGGLLLCSVTAFAATGVKLDSDQGDWIGQGQQLSASTVQVSGSSSHLTFSFLGFSADFVAPRNASLATGNSFSGATRFPFNSPNQAGMDISGNGRGCNTLSGWFEIREAVFATSGVLARAAIDFKQNCEGGTAALYGSIRYNSEQALELRQVAAIAGPSQSVMGRDTVLLDGRASFARTNGATPSFEWTQLSGRPVSLHGANSSMVDFVAPLVPPGGEDLLFQLAVRASSGAAPDMDTVRVSIGSKTDPQTYLQFNSEAGDYVGSGRSFRLTPSDGDISLSSNYRGGPSLLFNGNAFWMLEFGPAVGTNFEVGEYLGAQSFAFADPDRPGISVSGGGRGCNTISGKFNVIEAMKSGADIVRLALDYEQHCEAGSAALRGKIRWNYLEPGAPTANAGTDQTVTAGASVVLSGIASTDDQGIALYQWRQLSGPSAGLLGADTANASFTAPDVTQNQNLQFQLMVADGGDLTAADTLTVTVNPKPSTNGGGEGGGEGGGGSTSVWAVLVLLLLLASRRLFSRHDAI